MSSSSVPQEAPTLHRASWLPPLMRCLTSCGGHGLPSPATWGHSMEGEGLRLPRTCQLPAESAG